MKALLFIAILFFGAYVFYLYHGPIVPGHSGMSSSNGSSSDDSQAAKEHLKHELSEWMAGRKNEASCPIQNTDGHWVEPVIVNYDIKSVESVRDGVYSAVVTLTLQSEAGAGLLRARSYAVEHNSQSVDGWVVAGGHWNQ